MTRRFPASAFGARDTIPRTRPGGPMTTPDVPSAAVRIVEGGGVVRPLAAARAVAALARAGWLHDPAEIERLLDRVASQDTALRVLYRRLDDTSAAESALAALDAVPAPGGPTGAEGEA